ncbi:hypothetical protein [Thioalkalivibrio sp.]|uniref:hypothetical protein n=1 Tax=Thioalkalivibrio sp. TaxID=2093813 RepID=UPI0035680D73
MATTSSAPAMRSALNDMLWLLPVPLVLVVLSRVGVLLTDGAFVGVVLGLALFMTAGIWLRSVVRRRIFLAGALRADSPWYRHLRGGALMALVALAGAIPLAAILVVATVRVDGPHLLLGMVLNVPVLVLLRGFWSRRIAGHAVPRFRPMLALRLALAVNLGLLLLALAAAALFRTYPELSGLTLVDAVLSEAGRQQAASGLLQGLMQLAAAKDAMAWWLGQQVLPGVIEPGLQVAGWMVLVATDGLVVWSYLLICASVLTLVHWRAWHPGSHPE